MSNRKTRAQIARQTVDILEGGEYSLLVRTNVSIADSLARACEGTTLYSPDCFAEVFAKLDTARGRFATEFLVENATTLSAARRLVDADGSLDPLCLNFASAKNPGGGFLGGSRAQEESLARASGLYVCINPISEYYDTNRSCGTSLYTHHMIYSPKVPVFRDDNDELIPAPYLASFVTAPAVNAGAVRQNEPQRAALIESTMLERIERVLAVALLHGHDTIVLGAWGCGVFKNEPADVARWFHRHLAENERFKGAFRNVVFAVLDRSNNKSTFRAFASQFPSVTSGH